MLVVILVVLGCLLLIIGILELAVTLGMKKELGKRGDGSVSIRYPLLSEQTDLVYTKDYFTNNKGNRFSVIEYRHKDVKTPKALLLMIHGVGCGHSYLYPLINYFAKLGYLVVAYDQYASGSSEGSSIGSMTVGARDVKYALDYIDSKYSDLPLYIFGHSWGGYTASIALHYSKRIEKAIIISGFNRMSDFLRGGNNFFTKFIGLILSLIVVRKDAFKYGSISSVSALDAFKKTTAKVLYLQGINDGVVNPEYSGKLFQNALKNKENIEIKLLPNKEHTPFVTNESQAGQNEVGALFGFAGGVLVPIETYIDYLKISEPDLEVYKMMSDFLDK